MGAENSLTSMGFAKLAAVSVTVVLLMTKIAAADVPPDPRDVAVQEAMSNLQFLLGSWKSQTKEWPRNDDLRVAIDWEWGTIYIEDNYRRRILVLAYDMKSGKYKLYAPMAGGFEVVEVSRPDANTIVWVTHPDGPAIRSTITFSAGKLHKIDALLDVDGQVKPELDIIFDRIGTVDLRFAVPSEPR